MKNPKIGFKIFVSRFHNLCMKRFFKNLGTWKIFLTWNKRLVQKTDSSNFILESRVIELFENLVHVHYCIFSLDLQLHI